MKKLTKTFLKITVVLIVLVGTIIEMSLFSDKTLAESPIPTPKFYHAIPPSYYIACVSKKIKSYWHRPPNYTGEQLIVTFKIYPNGAISNLDCKTMYDPTGLYRNSVIKAVQNALPLPLPPKELLDPVRHYMTVNIDFRAFYRFKDNPIEVKPWFKDPNRYRN